MTKGFRKLFFLICLGAGALFGVLFFLLFGAEEGYSLSFAGICAVGGAFFAIAFYFIWIFTERFQKPFTFENPRAQARLLAYETEYNLPSERRAEGFLPFGKGLRQEICETFLYLCSNHIRIVFCHLGKIHTVKILYSETESVEIRGNALAIGLSGDGQWVIAVKNTSILPFLRTELRALNVPIIDGTMHVREILRRDEDAMEADIIVSDGEHQLLCYAHPFTESEQFTLSAFMPDHIMAADEADYRIEKTTDSYYSLRLQGVLIDRDNRLVRIGALLIELDGGIPNDIEECEFIEFTAERIDWIPAHPSRQ